MWIVKVIFALTLNLYVKDFNVLPLYSVAEEVGEIFRAEVMSNDTHKVTFKATLLDGITGDRIAELSTVEFDVPPRRLVSNVALAGVNNIVANEVWFNEDYETMVRELFGKGYFPENIYVLRAELHENDNIIAWAEKHIHIVEPGGPVLIYPGSEYSTTLDEINELRPTFVWTGNASRYRIKIIEVTKDGTPDDVIHLPAFIEEEVSRSYFDYPSGARPLEPGKKYAWHVIAIYQSPVRTIEMGSSIYGFKVRETVSEEVDEILAILEGVVSDEIISNLRDKDFHATGRIIFDGAEIDKRELIKIISEIKTGKHKLKRVELR